MSGRLRFLFAIMVVITHLAGLAGGVRFLDHPGFFSVMGFYMLSGFFITRILNETYRFNLLSFLANRALRLFPQYYLVIALTWLAVVLASPPISYHFFPNDWSLDASVKHITANLLVFPLYFEISDGSFIFIPQTWSLAVEMIAYLLLFLVVARSKETAIMMAFGEIAYYVISMLGGTSWQGRYYTVAGALLPFSLGASIYFCQHTLAAIKFQQVWRMALWAFVLWLANLAACGWTSGLSSMNFNVFFLLNTLILFLLIAAITDQRFERLGAKRDRLFGNLAYPVFLCHWLVGFIVKRTFFPGKQMGSLGIEFLLISLPFVLVSAYVLYLFQQYWVEPARQKIRSSQLNTARLRSPVHESA